MLVAATLAVAGFLAAVTYREAAAGAQGREVVREALREDVLDRSETTDELAVQLERLTGEVADAREAALAASVVGQRALDRLAVAEQQAGTVPVEGPGVVVTLGNAPPTADSDPVGGSEEVEFAGIVQDRDLQQLVNALWSVGAEAISINGQRLGPTSAIRQAGDAVLVDFRPLASPYEVSAIGDPDTLTRDLLSTPEATLLAQYTLDFGIVFEYVREDSLELPAGTGAELRHATVLDPPTGSGSSAPSTPSDGG
ncbi:uncharacterized protein YlxW (UPF0749 family) [Modestobacter roseus]|uniref:Uncharacterized protein YlxW (UPF0749 family) n=1 Tax=Modestobacter roseus TaxID=1181884 RepID=A0A562IQ98_9ACTN|nr:DUF881 domain-containing protein [Modestobacter roseus]TWH72774.1 uncharacterized protein YlxW (UPF0749 family) [Modestobacter roseus]